MFKRAQRMLRKRMDSEGKLLWVTDRAIPREGRVDSRPLSYGYSHYRELFNDRQLLHISLLAEAISEQPHAAREALIIAFSDHLTTNCMMTHYAFGWRRLAPLFSVRSYRHVTRPVEINPWLDGTGRGTFPNAVRQVERAVRWAKSPSEALREGGFRETPSLPDVTRRHSPKALILHRNSQSLRFMDDSSVSICLTDPPYFDNIAYSELSDFFLPWLQLLGLVKPNGGPKPCGYDENLSAAGRGSRAVAEFQMALGSCFSEVARVLKPGGRMIFTYQHRSAAGWLGLAGALASANLRPVQLFPLPGDGEKGLHTHDGSIKWDAVFVLKRGRARKFHNADGDLMLTQESLRGAQAHHRSWKRRLSRLKGEPFREPDSLNFYFACLTAAAVGLFPHGYSPDRPLRLLLKEHIQGRMEGDVASSCLTLIKRPFPNTSVPDATAN
jgi:adenine-specific DNA methylase